MIAPSGLSTDVCEDRLTFFRSAARGLHVPAMLTAEPTKHEARKRRANERPRVGCCEELDGDATLAVHLADRVLQIKRELRRIS
jgi:hypothetical protein